MKGENIMAKSLPDIIYDKNKVTPIIDARTSFYNIPFYKDEEFFASNENYVRFIKGCERLVRNNDRYKKYISYLKKIVKLNKCQVLKNVTDDDADIEMHHGPIFTLFDLCAIELEYFLVKKWKITTLRIADAVLTEHQKNRIQVVMLSSTIHEEVHNGNIFINRHQAFGDINAYLKKYGPVLTDDYKEKVNRYIDRSLLNDSNDFGVLELNKHLLQR